MRSKGRFQVFDYYSSNKVETFNMWLDAGKDWDKVSIQVERIHAADTEAKRGWIAVQGKDIRKTHESTKAETIIQLRKSTGMWYPSEDFENDDDDA